MYVGEDDEGNALRVVGLSEEWWSGKDRTGHRGNIERAESREQVM